MTEYRLYLPRNPAWVPQQALDFQAECRRILLRDLGLTGLVPDISTTSYTYKYFPNIDTVKVMLARITPFLFSFEPSTYVTVDGMEDRTDAFRAWLDVRITGTAEIAVVAYAPATGGPMTRHTIVAFDNKRDATLFRLWA